jgi:hypothetical protein
LLIVIEKTEIIELLELEMFDEVVDDDEVVDYLF